jgi:hypothetical protein
LNETFTNSKYFLEKNAFLVKKDDDFFTILKSFTKKGENVFLYKNIIKTHDLSNMYFSDISEEDFLFLDENYEIDFFRVSSYDFIYKTQDFVKKYSSSKKYKQFIKKNNYKIFYSYKRKKVKELFEK